MIALRDIIASARAQWKALSARQPAPLKKELHSCSNKPKESVTYQRNQERPQNRY